MHPMIHILKLCVGAESVEDLAQWQTQMAHHWKPGTAEHITRMWPKREADVLEGSLYWVIKGVILARQKILDLDRRDGADGIQRCALVLDTKIHRTEPAARRPFQGWRYLAPDEAPRDLTRSRPREEALPPGLAEAMAEFGLR
ncbi:DUF1489 domain-containing protein [Rhodobacter sp. KR11]|uniref:DUF1489 family protein n=1 Tax=Rhodobacter sp. KR11 TaxID=2974588 RepID=UPI002223E9AD|nr:DUF1489 domain-containing protein [Rhodobacter sp. KR11]MCW1917477.1 DUF1489 domain-containing protein [Rhodobacter sp. KR11]